jgi:pyrroline-5-carboxylate reductase
MDVSTWCETFPHYSGSSQLTMLPIKLGMIGSGQMATALASGLVRAELIAAESILASDPVAASRKNFERCVPGTSVVDNNQHVAAQADVLLLAVKPQQMNEALVCLRNAIRTEALVVSIAAGVTLARLTAALPARQRIVRVMPNTPCLIGRGASGYSLGGHATSQDGQLVGQLFSAVGAAFEVPEDQLDAVTGLSGSGPAFVYTMIESLRDGGVAAGLPLELAAELAARTVAGAAEMVLQTGETPDTLRKRVTSPGGTTLAGLAALEQHGFQSAVVEAVRAAARRSQELGQSST